MTDKEKIEVKNEIENSLVEKLDSKIKDKFDSFREFVDNAYKFQSSALKNASWIIGIAITIVSVLLTFFGVKTYNDIQATIKSNVEKELSSDQVIKQYRNELTTLKSKLIINEIEQNLAVTNIYGTTFYRKTLSEEYLQILTDAIVKKDGNSISCLQILNKYDDFIGDYDNSKDKILDDVNKIRDEKQLIDLIYSISEDSKNALLQRESFEFLVSYGTNQQVEKIVYQLKDYVINNKAGFTSIFKDYCKDYLVRLIVKVRRNKKNTSIRKDIVDICKAAKSNEDVELKFVGYLGLSLLTEEKVEDAVLSIIKKDKSKVDNLITIIGSYNKYFCNRYNFFRAQNQQVYNAKFLATIFEIWASDKRKNEGYIYYTWLPLTRQLSLYNSLFNSVMKTQKSNGDKLWVAKVFVPDDISLFSQKSFKELPVLRAKINGKVLTVYYDSFEDALTDENGDKVSIDVVSDFSILVKPNPNFDENNSEDRE